MPNRGDKKSGEGTGIKMIDKARPGISEANKPEGKWLKGGLDQSLRPVVRSTSSAPADHACRILEYPASRV